MGFFGLDVLAIRSLARQLDNQSAEVRSAVTELSAVINSTQWFGADQAAFVRDWEAQHRTALLRASALLQQASEIAQRGATDQERVSRN